MERLGLSEIIFRFPVRDLPVESWSAFFFVRHDYCTTGAGRNPAREHTGRAPHHPVYRPQAPTEDGRRRIDRLFPVEWIAPRAGARSPGWAGMGGSGSLGCGPKVRARLGGRAPRPAGPDGTRLISWEDVRCSPVGVALLPFVPR